MGDSARELLKPLRDSFAKGLLPLGVFNNEQIFSLEQSRIFARSWCFLGHESEIPEIGDYVLRYIGDDCFIVVRGEGGSVHALLNACRHRGRQVCSAESGHTRLFNCPYHGWSYGLDGTLRGVPHQAEIFGETFDRKAAGLAAAPRLGIWRGLVFANLDPDAESLEDFLGEAKWYLDFYANKSAAGLEVIGSPQRWVVEADWKLGADNFIGDGYHTATTHLSAIKAGILPVRSGDFLLEGVQVVLEHFGVGFARQDPQFNSLAYPSSHMEALRGRLDADQLALLDRGVSLPTHATLFPNLSFLNAPGAFATDQPPAPYLTLRTWRPLGPGRAEVCSWLLVEADADDNFKDASARAYVLSFGSSGTLEQDDAENWSSISRAARGQYAKTLPLNYTMGRESLDPLTDWPGPGTAYPLDYTEFAQRAFWLRWLSMLETE